MTIAESDHSLSGYTRYLPTGEKVVVSHIIGDAAYVHPVFIIQSTNYHGDDFEEHEDTSDHLICVSASKLSKEAPLAALSTEVAALKGQIADLNREKTAEQKDLSAARKEFMDLNQQVMNWRRQNPCFDRIVKLLNGEEMIALVLPSWQYRCDMPRLATAADAAALQLIHKGGGKFGWAGHWRQDHDRFGDTKMEAVEFFDTEEDMQTFVTGLWDEVLRNFAKTPKDTQFGYPSPTGKLISYKMLTQWVERFPFLAIPDSVEADKAAYEAKNKADLLAQAKARVAELEEA